MKFAGACAKVGAWLLANDSRFRPTGEPNNQTSSTLMARPIYVPAELAYNCTKSLPFNATAGAQLLEALKPFVEWQTNLEHVKSPPKEYAEKVQQPFDFHRELQDITKTVTEGKFESEYDFGARLYKAFADVHDGHFGYIPDSVGKLFRYGRPISLVSVSTDGIQYPVIYAYKDILESQSEFDAGSKTPLRNVSHIVQIDDQDAEEFVRNLARKSRIQDQDAQYNNVFVSLPQLAASYDNSDKGMFAGSGEGQYIYPGAWTKYTFANGTVLRVENFASWAHSEKYFMTNKSETELARAFFRYEEKDYGNLTYFTQPKPTNATKAISLRSGDYNPNSRETKRSRGGEKRSGPARKPFRGYPVAEMYDDSVQLYYLKSPNQGNHPHFATAVVVFKTFQPRSDGPQFQSSLRLIMEKLKKERMTHIIFDVQANGGGYINHAFEAFHAFFPTHVPFSGTRWRIHESFNTIATLYDRGFEKWGENLDGAPTLNDQAKEMVAYSSLNYRLEIDSERKPFNSLKDKFTSELYNYSRVIQHNWDHDKNELNMTWGVTGYAHGSTKFGDHSLREYQKGYFKPENMVVLTDGYCASACSIFADLMKQKDVRHFAVGGRSQYGPMQAIGGTKGAHVMDVMRLSSMAEWAKPFATLDWDKSLLDRMTKAAQLLLRRAPEHRMMINVRDLVRSEKDDPEQIPAQFRYQPADCRLFETPHMKLKIVELWKAVADSMAPKGMGVGTGKSKCIDERATNEAGIAKTSDSNSVAEEDVTAVSFDEVQLSGLEAYIPNRIDDESYDDVQGPDAFVRLRN